MATASNPDLYTRVKDFITRDSLGPITMEMMRIFPDGLLITSGIYAIITISFPFSIFFGSMVEAAFFFHAIRYVTTYLNILPVAPTSASFKNICRTGFTDTSTSPTLGSLSQFGSWSDGIPGPFPSPPIYMLSVASAYLFSTLNAQSKELAALGPKYSSRYYVSMIFLTLLIFLFVCFRIGYSCDSFPVAIISVPVGLFIGMLLVQQNKRLFGVESINLVGIPMLSSRTANGKKIYVCNK
jgi:hypothetical protein